MVGSAKRVLATAVSALVLAVPVAPASSHSEIVSTEPSSGELVERSVPLIVATFNEEVTLPRLVVRDNSGRIVAGRIQRGGPTERVVFRPTKPLRRGSYLVQWRVRSADGHWVSGSWRFRIVPR
jgi:methionine-rich copper-binding protein CopC